MEKKIWAKPRSTTAASVRRHKFRSGSPGLGTCHKLFQGWWQLSGKGIERNWLWPPGSHHQSGGGVGRGVVLFPAPCPEVNVKDWRNKAGIYWEGADLLGTGGQGSINLLLPLRADPMVVGCTAPVPACLSLRVLKTGHEAMAPCMGAFHFLPFPRDLPR